MDEVNEAQGALLGEVVGVHLSGLLTPGDDAERVVVLHIATRESSITEILFDQTVVMIPVRGEEYEDAAE